MRKTAHRTRISFLDDRPAIILTGWLNPQRLLLKYGPKALVEHGHMGHLPGNDALVFINYRP